VTVTDVISIGTQAVVWRYNIFDTKTCCRPDTSLLLTVHGMGATFVNLG
jgi:hypothetical protein